MGQKNCPISPLCRTQSSTPYNLTRLSRDALRPAGPQRTARGIYGRENAVLMFLLTVVIPLQKGDSRSSERIAAATCEDSARTISSDQHIKN